MKYNDLEWNWVIWNEIALFEIKMNEHECSIGVSPCGKIKHVLTMIRIILSRSLVTWDFPEKSGKKYSSSVLYIYILFVDSICWFEPNEIPYLIWLMFEPSVPQLSSSMGVVLLPGELQRRPKKNVKPRRPNQFPWVTRRSIPQTHRFKFHVDYPSPRAASVASGNLNLAMETPMNS